MGSNGPVILDLVGMELTSEERDILQHPLVGGVILFARNYDNPRQLIQLVQHIRQSRSTPLLISVDHEGGRVQRFRTGFTSLPSQGKIGELYKENAEAALELADIMGWMIATELLSVGVDLSFAPVLDLDKEICPAIGNRAFHALPNIVAELGIALVKGMNRAGMAATGKHFPGHGAVSLDSHIAIPIDGRNQDEIFQEDILPFVKLIQVGIQAIMPAHIIFPQIDAHPVGFSAKWLKDILRKQLKFSGVIFSDDLNMEGASFAGDYTSRAKAALEAGCDMVLICNNRLGAIEILDHLPHKFAIKKELFYSLMGKQYGNYDQLIQSNTWKKNNELIKKVTL